MRREEKLAASIIAQAIPGTRLDYQQNQSNGECDFDLVYPTGVIEPLEVTTSTDQDLERIEAMIRGRRGDGMFVARHKATNDWYVTPTESVDVTRLRNNVDVYLAAVEIDGYSEFFAPIDAGRSKAVWNIWTDLKVEAGSVFKWKPPGRIGISTPGGGGLVSSKHVVAAINFEAAKPDNRKKLGRSLAPRRHLVIVVGHCNYLVEKSMRSGRLPSESATLPSEITDAWIISSLRHGNTYVVWRTDGSGTWQAVGKYEVLESAG